MKLSGRLEMFALWKDWFISGISIICITALRIPRLQ